VARLTRHELKKRDELSVRMEVAAEFFLTHRRKITLVLSASVIAIVLFAGVLLFFRSRQSRAADALAQALQTYHAAVLPNPPANSTVVSFPTEQEKYEKALAQFTEVGDDYSFSSAGEMARYYAALSKRELGQVEEAERDLRALADDADAELSSLTKMALAGLYEQTDRPAEAEAIYKELAERPTRSVPKATAQLAHANLLSKTNPSQAAALYQQIMTEHAGTTAAEYASGKLPQ
jgi:predicted negative regulator of RcsB-dependent stress response